MDSITIDSKAESKWVKGLIRKEELHYIWTGGRKCNFKVSTGKFLGFCLFHGMVLNSWLSMTVDDVEC